MLLLELVPVYAVPRLSGLIETRFEYCQIRSKLQQFRLMAKISISPAYSPAVAWFHPLRPTALF